MQKYIAVITTGIDEDEISRMLAQGIAGALFEISHQNYPAAVRLVQRIKSLSQSQNRPINVIQDVTRMQDPLELEFGVRTGIDKLVASQPDHIKIARGINRLIPIIWKGENPPREAESVMVRKQDHPDAVVGSAKPWHISHLVKPHAKHNILDSLLHVASQAHAAAIVVSNLEIAKALSKMHPNFKIVFFAKDLAEANKSLMFWGVHPVISGAALPAALFNHHLAHKGERVLDARDLHHVAIQLLSMA